MVRTGQRASAAATVRSVKFDGNAAVLLNATARTIGTRIFGPVTRELRTERFMKIVSLALKFSERTHHEQDPQGRRSHRAAGRDKG